MAEVQLRLAVAGTSNAILGDGYLAGLKASPYVTGIRRHCIGGSPSIFLSVVGEEMDPSDYDVCIIDAAINDDVHCFAKCHTILDAYEHTLSFMRRLARGGCMPLLLCMHEVDWFARKTAASEMYRALAERHNCGHYDARWFFSPRRERGSASLSHLFRDKAHPNAETSLALGRALAEHAHQLNRPWQPPEHSNLVGPGFRLVRPDTFGKATRAYTSSLRSDQFVSLREGEHVSVELACGERLCGFVFNSANSDGVVRITGDRGETVWNVSSRNRDKALRSDKSFISQVTPIPWTNLGGRLRVEALRAHDHARDVVGADRRNVTSAYVELGTLVVRCPRSAA